MSGLNESREAEVSRPEDGQQHSRFDPHAFQAAQRQRQWIRVLGDWLSTFHWQAYLTLTFRYAVSAEYAIEMVRVWLAGLGPEVYAYMTVERGDEGLRTHIHLLLGGLARSRSATGLHLRLLNIKRAGRRWKHGDADAREYDPRRGACWYVAKNPEYGEFLGSWPQRQMRRTR